MIKDCTRGITLLKLTTDRHKALRSLCTMAELPVEDVLAFVTQSHANFHNTRRNMPTM